MDFNRLETLEVAAREGSFAAAAQCLFVSPSSVVQQVKGLEASLGFALFDRGPRGVSLTPAGRRFLEGAGRLRDEYRALVSQCAEDALAGEVLSVAVSPNLSQPFLMSACTEFIARGHGRIRTETIAGVPAKAQAVASGRVDACVLTNFDRVEGSVAVEPLFPIKQYAVVHASHPLSSRGSVDPEDLAGARVAAWENSRYYGRLLPRLAELGAELCDPMGDLGGAMSFMMGGGVLVSGKIVGDQFGDSFSAVPIDYDLGISYCVAYPRMARPVVLEFVGICRKLAGAGGR